ncbi:MAG TPA: PhzF family phenazine biosynthesis protein [Cyclobacteriaceae bacterium]
MKLKIYQVDAFADKVFSGNPAAVCPLDQWLPDDILQSIAMENNLAETAFYVKEGSQYHLRWFTPTVEVDLCGHATLAAAYVLFHYEDLQSDTVHFHSPRSGPLSVKRNNDLLTLNFPVDILEPTDITPLLTAGFDRPPQLAFKGKSDYLLVYDKEEDIKKLAPSMDQIAKIKARGVIVTARGNEVDFVSRFFAPQSGVDEDPVTGSAHTTLTPYWSRQLNKVELTARQLSRRGGNLKCKLLNDRVEIGGHAKLYLIGEIFI